MDPHSGDVYRLREELVGEPGDRIEMEELRRRVAGLGEDASADEAASIRAKALVSVSEEAARRLQLGERELQRRRRRRKAERRARRRQRGGGG